MTSAQWPQATRETANDKLLQADTACTLNKSAIPRTGHTKGHSERHPGGAYLCIQPRCVSSALLPDRRPAPTRELARTAPQKQNIAWSQNHSRSFSQDLDCETVRHWPLAVSLGRVTSISTQILPATVSNALDCGDRQKSDVTRHILSFATCSRARAMSKVFRIEPSRSQESHWSRPWLCLALHGTVIVPGPNSRQRSRPPPHRVYAVVVARIPFILGGPYCAKPCTNEGSRPPKRLCATSSPTNKYSNKYLPNK